MYAIGLMSGTSLDGVDCVLCEVEGHGEDTQLKVLAFETTPYDAEIKRKIKAVCNVNTSRVDALCSLNFELGALFAKCVKQCCANHHFPLSKLDFIASHGQTIFHLPNSNSLYRSTLQIGESAVIAYQTKCQVIDDFRVMDMAAGGEGAPLVPYSEYLLYRKRDTGRILQNIGGIGNATILPKNCTLEQMLAFDTGPGNMMIDEAMGQLYHKAFDEGGAIAASGKVNQAMLTQLMQDEFLTIQPPKSTGREVYGEAFVSSLLHQYKSVSKADIIATLTYFTAKTIAYHYTTYIFPNYDVQEVIVGGGGAHNQTLLGYLRELCPSVTIYTQEELGYSSDAKEAIAFVILGNETLHGCPSNVIQATGAKERVVLGKITPAP